MNNIDSFITISGWLFGLISCVCAIIQTIQKNKYKKQIYNQKINAKDTNGSVIQIGGIDVEH